MTDNQMLQCPDCSHRHAVDGLGAVETFGCQGCGRPLKVPASLRGGVSAGAMGVATGSESVSTDRYGASPGPQNSGDSGWDPTTVMPTVDDPSSDPSLVDANVDWGATKSGRSAQTTAATQPISIWIRLLIWVLAVPVGLAVVFSLAKRFHIVTSQQLIDTFSAQGWHRFAPIAKVLPFAALLIALIVQGTVTFFERRAAAAATGAESRSETRTAGSTPNGLETRDVR